MKRERIGLEERELQRARAIAAEFELSTLKTMMNAFYTSRKTKMHTTIGQISYPDRQAFFEKLALNLPAQPAIRIGPAPLPSGGRRLGSRNMRKAVPTEMLSTAQRSMEPSPRFH